MTDKDKFVLDGAEIILYGLESVSSQKGDTTLDYSVKNFDLSDDSEFVLGLFTISKKFVQGEKKVKVPAYGMNGRLDSIVSITASENFLIDSTNVIIGDIAQLPEVNEIISKQMGQVNTSTADWYLYLNKSYALQDMKDFYNLPTSEFKTNYSRSRTSIALVLTKKQAVELLNKKSLVKIKTDGQIIEVKVVANSG